MLFDQLFKGEELELQRRMKVVAGVFTVAFLVISFRLFQLQVLRGAEMAQLSKRNRTELVFFRAPRGRILDRNGNVLVDNRASFTVFYYPEILTPQQRDQVENRLSDILKVTREDMAYRVSTARRYRQMVRLWEDVPREIALALIERNEEFPGTIVVNEPRRRHKFGTSAAHLLGYVSEIGSIELTQPYFEGYKMGDYVGRTGVEKTMEKYLRGQAGGFELEVDVSGNFTHLAGSAFESVPGRDVVVTLDQRLQDVADRLLAATPKGAGACVALNPWTGEILALSSHPGYNPDEFARLLLTDEKRPLFNRAISGTYPLGSVYKIITAASALEEHKIVPQTVFFCPGYFNLNTRTFKCWSKHGKIDFHEGLVWSCDVYFYNTGLRAGPELLERYSTAFGLGRVTGIDLPSEAAGIGAGPSWKKKALKQHWYNGDTVNLSIGQGYLTATPLQAACLMAAVANGGMLWKPFVAMKVIDSNGVVREETHVIQNGKFNLSGDVWELLRSDLRQVVVRGTGQAVNVPGLDVRGKTGTAQNPHGDDHAWFVAYAGRENELPQIVVAVIVEQGGHGGSVAAPIVRKVIEAAFGVQGV